MYFTCMWKRLYVCLLLTCFAAATHAQTDKWAGTWRMELKQTGDRSPVSIEFHIGMPESGGLYPAKIQIKYGQFTGIYEVLLARKNDQQLGIGRGKYPIQETPVKLGIWMMYLNGTLDYTPAGLQVNRMWIDRAGIWMRGLYDEGDLWVHTKATLRDVLYRESILLKRTDHRPWTDPHTKRILHPEEEDIYFGIYDQINVKDSIADLHITEGEKQDKDTVTLLHNGRPLLVKSEVTDSNRYHKVLLDTGVNIFTFFADNYGQLPPNTINLRMTLDDHKYGFDFTDRANAFATFLVARIYREPAVTDTLTHKAEGRKTEPVATLIVNEAAVTLELWDGQLEDGDSVSLRLNGKWMATGFPVKNKIQKIHVELLPGENRLLFMADNLGSIPPNTAELRIRYGNKTKTLGLNTDMKRNNEIVLIYEP